MTAYPSEVRAFELRERRRSPMKTPFKPNQTKASALSADLGHVTCVYLVKRLIDVETSSLESSLHAAQPYVRSLRPTVVLASTHGFHSVYICKILNICVTAIVAYLQSAMLRCW